MISDCTEHEETVLCNSVRRIYSQKFIPVEAKLWQSEPRSFSHPPPHYFPLKHTNNNSDGHVRETGERQHRGRKQKPLWPSIERLTMDASRLTVFQTADAAPKCGPLYDSAAENCELSLSGLQRKPSQQQPAAQRQSKQAGLRQTDS